jgi:Sulfotransferase family
MIVSHKHRFIFLKTEKTAGTSLQTALAGLCGADDIISGARRDPVSNKPVGVKPRLGIGRYITIPTEIKRRLPGIAGFYPHMSARQMRSVIGREIWDSYYKFAVERNPWDRQVSNYFHRQSRSSSKQDFERYITSPIYRQLHHVRLNNWGIYTIKDEIVVDTIIRYENLEVEFPAVLRTIGLAAELTLPRSRASHRPNGVDYRRFYSDRAAEVVGRWYAKEIEAFGYEF